MLEEGDGEQAVEVLRHAAKTHPQEYLAHFKLAQAYAKAGNQVGAEAEQKVATEIRAIREEFAKLHQEAWDRPLDRNVRLRLAAIAGQLAMPEIADNWRKAANAIAPTPGTRTDGNR